MSVSKMRNAIQSVSRHASAVLRLQRELAAVELKQKAAKLGAGAAMLAAALFLLVLMIPFALATIAVALSLVLPWWASLLIVTGGLLVVAGILAAIGVKALKKGVPPAPTLAIAEAKKTKAVLKG
jgi:hypothetical protein